jgi:hypothetical protein
VVDREFVVSKSRESSDRNLVIGREGGGDDGTSFGFGCDPNLYCDGRESDGDECPGRRRKPFGIGLGDEDEGEG